MFTTDQILWYNNGAWGELGYAAPNFGNNPTTLNHTIASVTANMGRNLAAVMRHADADLRTPPSINTIRRVHQLCNRIRQILAGRAVAPGETRFEATHVTPAPQDFLIFPVPYFKVRNSWMKEWCALALNAISEAVQHKDNRISYEITEDFSGRIGQYIHRIYKLLATELFNVPAEQTKELTFVLTDEQLKGYNPSAFFTGTELIDTVRPSETIPTEDDLVTLTDGIPASSIAGFLQRWPAGAGTSSPTAGEGQPTTTGTTVSSFTPPPGP